MVVSKCVTRAFKITFVDELADSLTRTDIFFDIVLPRIAKRETLEEQGKLGPKISPLEAELDSLLKQNGEQKDDKEQVISRSRSRDKSEKKSRHRLDSSDEDNKQREKGKEKKDKKEKKEKKKLKKMIKESKRDRVVSPDKDNSHKLSEENYWKKLRQEQGLN